MQATKLRDGQQTSQKRDDDRGTLEIKKWIGTIVHSMGKSLVEFAIQFSSDLMREFGNGESVEEEQGPKYPDLFH